MLATTVPMKFYICVVSVSLLVSVNSDVYMHNPRGSNNRLEEKSAQRQNANRVFDSQNNNRGGYNVGDATENPFGNDENKQYQMKFFQSDATSRSRLTIEWTNQHGCGGNENTDPHKQNCNIVLQYMCQKDDEPVSDETLRDGVDGGTQTFKNARKLPESKGNKQGRKSVSRQKVVQEPWDWYNSCYMRERNKGLFTADQVLKKNALGVSSAIYTRQNPNGNRFGYECPEERDYFPYWHPTPWKDIAVLAENTSMCQYYKKKSFNVQPYYQCVELYPSGGRQLWSQWNNKVDCEENKGKWLKFYNYLEKVSKPKNKCESSSGNGIRYIWGVPYDAADPNREECLIALNAPDCQEAPWSRSNHLGNGREGKPNTYLWDLPYFPSNKDYKCVLRIRYNISTDDYDPYNTNSSHNKNLVKGIESPVQQNPYVEIGAGHTPLRLAINTAQFGRTFQDRSHVFKLLTRPKKLKNMEIVNLNVRGKRGNIVQVYPAVEYDFVPNDLSIKEGVAVHLQWTGSNTHNNGNPAGDGQAGDAGEGKGGSDRNNIVQIASLNDNFPLPFELSTMWKDADILWIHHGEISISSKDLAVNVASSGYYYCMMNSKCSGNSAEKKAKMQNQLNNAPASYEGVVVRFKKGTYYYMCTRNNNFTNRSQKGKIVVR